MAGPSGDIRHRRLIPLINLLRRHLPLRRRRRIAESVFDFVHFWGVLLLLRLVLNCRGMLLSDLLLLCNKILLLCFHHRIRHILLIAFGLGVVFVVGDGLDFFLVVGVDGLGFFGDVSNRFLKSARLAELDGYLVSDIFRPNSILQTARDVGLSAEGDVRHLIYRLLLLTR